MSTPLQLRNVPDEAREVFKRRAAERRMSMNAYLVDLLVREASQPTLEEVLARAAARPESLGLSSADAVRADRDEHERRFG